MTPADKKEFKEILHDYVAGVMAKQDAKFEIIDAKLDFIKEQTTKTNGRVSVLENKVDGLERKELTHTINCPVAPRVAEIERDLNGTGYVKRFLKSSLGIGVMIFTIVWTLMKIIEMFYV